MPVMELIHETKATQERFKRIYEKRLKKMEKGLLTIPDTEGLTAEDKRFYLAHITLKEVKEKVKKEEERREKFDNMIAEKYPHLSDAFIPLK